MKLKSLLETAGVAHLPKAKQLIALDEGFKEAQTEFAQASSPGEAQERINQFRDLVNRNQVQGNERNIDFWRKQGWEQFNAFVSTKSQEKSKTQEKRSKSEGRSITIHEDPNWLVVVPIDKDASCFHGKNTDWCTTKPNARWFEQYVYRNGVTLIYFLKIATGDKWAIACYPNGVDMEMFDKNDRKITSHQFKQQTGFTPVVFKDRVMKSVEIKSASVDARTTYKEAEQRVMDALNDIDQRDTKVEHDLLLIKDPELIVRYCKYIGERWPKMEKFIANHPEEAVEYAKDVIGGRWPEAEPHIMQRAGPLREYALDVLGGRWPEAELDMIERGAGARALGYATRVMKHRWPEAEKAAIDMANRVETEYHTAGDDEVEADQAYERLKSIISIMSMYKRDIIRGAWPAASDLFRRYGHWL